jgi:hypothetical protein
MLHCETVKQLFALLNILQYDKGAESGWAIWTTSSITIIKYFDLEKNIFLQILHDSKFYIICSTQKPSSITEAEPE